MKKMLAVLVASIMTISMTACGKTVPEGSGTKEESKSKVSTSSNSTGRKAAMVTAQPLGDKGVTDNTYEGFKKGCEEFGYDPTVIEVKEGEYEETLRSLAQEKYDIIMPCWGALEDACSKVSADFPDSKFILVYSKIDLPNVKSLMSKQEEGSYLAGVDAAKTTKTNHIAFMGGSDNPTINQFRAGFEAGARSINPDINIDATWVGSFTDPAKAKDLALMLYDQGADIIYVAAAASSTGVFDAAKETGGQVVGCDVDQNDLVPGQVIGSMVIDYGSWVYQCFQEENDTGLKFGPYTYGLDNNGLDFVLPKDSTYKTDDEVVNLLKDTKKDIIDGKINVSEVPEE